MKVLKRLENERDVHDATETHPYTYIYICVCVCVCVYACLSVCVCVYYNLAIKVLNFQPYFVYSSVKIVITLYFKYRETCELEFNLYLE